MRRPHSDGHLVRPLLALLHNPLLYHAAEAAELLKARARRRDDHEIILAPRRSRRDDHPGAVPR